MGNMDGFDFIHYVWYVIEKDLNFEIWELLNRAVPSRMGVITDDHRKQHRIRALDHSLSRIRGDCQYSVIQVQFYPSKSKVQFVVTGVLKSSVHLTVWREWKTHVFANWHYFELESSDKSQTKLKTVKHNLSREEIILYNWTQRASLVKLINKGPLMAYSWTKHFGKFQQVVYTVRLFNRPAIRRSVVPMFLHSLRLWTRSVVFRENTRKSTR